jgi:HSP20 family protein
MLRRFDPLREGLSLREAMDRLIEDSFVGPAALSGATASVNAPADLWETPDAFHMRIDLPGMRSDDIDISVTGDTVHVTAEHKEEKEERQEGFLRHERRTGRVQRAFSLPTIIDAAKVDAEFRDGVLHLTLPKSEEVKPKSVKVRGAGTTSPMR